MKARRWTARHRVLVTSAAAVVVVGTLGLIAGTLLLSQANVDLGTANATILAREKGRPWVSSMPPTCSSKVSMCVHERLSAPPLEASPVHYGRPSAL